VFWVMVLVTGAVVVGVIELLIRFRRAARTFDRIIDLSSPSDGCNRRQLPPGYPGTLQEREPGPERGGTAMCWRCGDRVAAACDLGDEFVCIPAGAAGIVLDIEHHPGCQTLAYTVTFAKAVGPTQMQVTLSGLGAHKLVSR
jgi:hypothetical protein